MAAKRPAPASVALTRSQVLAHRVARSGLDRSATPDRIAEIEPLDLGVQDSNADSARQGLANRLGGDPADVVAAVDDALGSTLALVWSYRGAPHVHRRADLPAVAAASWPRSNADATARVGSGAKRLGASGIEPLDAFRLAVEAMAAADTKPMTKGELSAAVTERLPGALSAHCRGCDAVHVFEMLFRSTALAAGLEFVPGAAPATLRPMRRWKAVAPDDGAVAATAEAYLRLLGPGTEGDVANFIGTRRADLGDGWPEGLVRVTAEGRPSWLPESALDALRSAPPPRLVRLLAPSDPYLQGRDRDLLVPDAARQKELWKILGNPGALLVDGEIAGTWRAKLQGRKRLTVTVAPFARLARRVVTELDDEAARLAVVRGAAEATVVIA